MLVQQIERVERLADEAHNRSLQLSTARRRLKQWQRDTLASPVGLVCAFGAGALLGAARPRTAVRGLSGRFAVSAANAIWLLGRLGNTARRHAHQPQAKRST